MIIPGSIGAFAGDCFLSNLPGEIIKPYISIFLLFLGGNVLFRFMFKFNYNGEDRPISLSQTQSISLGLVAGFADATGGGGWGPITTPILLTRNGISARKVIGTVDTSEFAVSVSATLGFLISIGWEEVNWFWVFTLMLGGVIAAPIAAWLVRKLPSYLLGVIVGGFIILTNVHTLVNAFSITKVWMTIVYSS
ncbi:putative membrane protein YfcA [Neobacillus niacini]|nr:putative membrane protein YfcA [Neobacillus niacini]